MPDEPIHVSTSDPPPRERLNGHHIARVKVDRDLCIGAANCVAIAPEGFELDAENIAVVKPGWEGLNDDILLQAAEACPTKAIFLYDENNNQIYP